MHDVLVFSHPGGPTARLDKKPKAKKKSFSIAFSIGVPELIYVFHCRADKKPLFKFDRHSYPAPNKI